MTTEAIARNRGHTVARDRRENSPSSSRITGSGIASRGVGGWEPEQIQKTALFPLPCHVPPIFLKLIARGDGWASATETSCSSYELPAWPHIGVDRHSPCRLAKPMTSYAGGPTPGPISAGGGWSTKA